MVAMATKQSTSHGACMTIGWHWKVFSEKRSKSMSHNDVEVSVPVHDDRMPDASWAPDEWQRRRGCDNRGRVR